MRWLCDEMLARLARVLRAAGEDVVVAQPGAPDAQLLAKARAESRWLATRDRNLAQMAGSQGLLLLADSALGQAEEVARSHRLDWRTRRFTRCLIDNTPLQEARPEDLLAAPRSARNGPGPFRRCPSCGRIYWPGSHVRRLNERLDLLAQLAELTLPNRGDEYLDLP